MSVPSERGPGVGPFGQSPQSRWLVIQQPTALPGSCFICQGSISPDPPVGRKWFVDLDLQFEFWGAVYICNLCLAEIAGTVGWFEPERADELRSDNEKLKAEVYRLQVHVASLQALEKAANDYLSSRSSSGIQFGSSGSGPLHVIQGEAGSQGTEDQLGAGAGTPDESGDVEGVDDIRSDDSGDGTFFGTFIPGDE